MSSSKDPEVRSRALQALKQGEFDLAEKALAAGNYALADLIEDLHIYEAELVIQNEELRASELATTLAFTRFQSLFTSLPLPVLVLDDTGEIIDSNQHAIKLLCLTSQHMRRSFLLRLIYPEYQADVAGFISGREGSIGQVFREVVFTVDDPPLIADLHLASLPTQSGGAREWVCALVDQRDQIAHRRAINAHQEHLRLTAAVFDAAGEGIMVTDEQGNVIAVNRMFCSITGYNEAEVIGRNPRFLSSGRHTLRFYGDFWHTLLSTDHWSGILWNRRKNGSLYRQETTLSTIRDPSGSVIRFVALMREVTDPPPPPTR